MSPANLPDAVKDLALSFEFFVEEIKSREKLSSDFKKSGDVNF